jgi:hypothetical protein
MANQLYIQEGVVSTGTKKGVLAQFFDMRKWTTNLLIEYGLIASDPCCVGGSSGVSGNISNAKYSVYNNLVANGDCLYNNGASFAVTPTTLVLNYGVNVITTTTQTNYACKLPQPVTGKVVLISNTSLYPLYVFPSNIGGSINKLAVDAPFIVPADGNTYQIVCTKNPLPGGWNVLSSPSTNQIVMPVVNIAHVQGTANYYAVSDTTVTNNSGGTLACGLINGPNYVVKCYPSRAAWLSLPTQATGTYMKVYSNVLATDLGAQFSGNIIYVSKIYAEQNSQSNINNSTGTSFVGFCNPPADIINIGPATYPLPVVSTTSSTQSPLAIGDLNTLSATGFEVYGPGEAGLGPDPRVFPGGWNQGAFYVAYVISIPANAVTKTYSFQIIQEYF